MENKTSTYYKLCKYLDCDTEDTIAKFSNDTQITRKVNCKEDIKVKWVGGKKRQMVYKVGIYHCLNRIGCSLIKHELKLLPEMVESL